MNPAYRRKLWSGGGKHQRLVRARLGTATASTGPASSNNATPQGPLEGDAEVDVLLELWALGILSASMVQYIAAAANKAAPRPQMATLAGLGTHGAWKANIHRDLM